MSVMPATRTPRAGQFSENEAVTDGNGQPLTIGEAMRRLLPPTAGTLTEVVTDGNGQPLSLGAAMEQLIKPKHA
jgi:hypothetical protein